MDIVVVVAVVVLVLLTVVGLVALVTSRAVDAAFGRLLATNREMLAAERERHDEAVTGRERLVEQRLAGIDRALTEVGALVQGLERDRTSQYSSLATQLAQQRERVAALHETTRDLRDALGNVKVRGQWGERMAEDVLRIAGFREGIQYRKQQTVASGGRPDFVFLMPDGHVLTMDVKFPLDNYLRHLDATDEHERARSAKAFVHDVRGHVKALSGRGYAQHGGALDCVLLFIPNEQVFAFVHEQAPEVIDEATAARVLLCSPSTLFGVLAVIRHAVDQFQVARTSDRILELLGDVRQQWELYVKEMDRLGRSLDTARTAYDELVGKRQRGIERVLERVDAVRATGVEAAAPGGSWVESRTA